MDQMHAEQHPAGRWPANLILGCACDGDAHEPECAVAMLDEMSGERTSGLLTPEHDAKPSTGWSGGSRVGRVKQVFGGDTGGASRYFKIVKADNTVDCHDSFTYNSGDKESPSCSENASTAAKSSTQNLTMFGEDLGGSAPENAGMQDSERMAKPTPGGTGEPAMADGIESGGNREAGSSTNNLKIDGSGSKQTGQFQTDTKSITSTATNPTTTSQISNALPSSGTTTITNESEKTIESSTALSGESASDATSTSHLTSSSDARAEPIRGTANPVNGNTSENGGDEIENTTSPITAPIDNAGEPQTRFLYTAKSSRAERNKGLEGMPERAHGLREDGRFNSGGRTQVDGEWIETGSEPKAKANHHPTVKPLSLMQWLCRLVTPPGGTVLDPFGGSGSTMVAADREGFHGIYIDMDEEYAAIARKRVYGDAPLFAEVAD
jgi:hypothetical protein